ncbi:MAG: hypothetical protein MK080_04920 [Opitutales bacterium]|nr:hypothetical protein [Opitutales bacterium]NRA27761.1 hypothetical protein [Opitutales bacterium]
MPIYTFSLGRCTARESLSSLIRPPRAELVPGLIHSEPMTIMQLGAPILSPSRMQLRNLALFASWKSETAIDDFLANSQIGRRFAAGWHVRMHFLRRWGSVREMDELPEAMGTPDPDAPVVAVTLARLRLPKVPRFIQWGKPVERLVRDNPAATLSTAAIRLSRTVSTFSIWSSLHEMTAMVHGHSKLNEPRRHADAMHERERKDFHLEFTTLRFSPIAEYGSWLGKSQHF